MVASQWRCHLFVYFVIVTTFEACGVPVTSHWLAVLFGDQRAYCQERGGAQENYPPLFENSIWRIFKDGNSSFFLSMRIIALPKNGGRFTYAASPDVRL